MIELQTIFNLCMIVFILIAIYQIGKNIGHIEALHEQVNHLSCADRRKTISSTEYFVTCSKCEGEEK